MKDVINMTIKEIEEVIEHNKKLEAELIKANKAIDSLSEIFKSLEGKENGNLNKYSREIKKGVYVDVYDVLKSFEVENPAVQHAIKKLLASGQRGYKDTIQDLIEAMQSIQRAIELEDE